MDKKRAKIKKDEYLRKLDENTKDLPMSKEGSPIVEKVIALLVLLDSVKAVMIKSIFFEGSNLPT